MGQSKNSKKIECIKIISSLIGKKNIYFFDSCDDAIFYVLKKLKSLGFEKIFIPDSGGWFSYKKFPKKLGLELIEVQTLNSKLSIKDLEKKLSENNSSKNILILHSLAGYFTHEPMNEILSVCKKYGVVLINDVCGSIGSKDAKLGDYVVCSTGINKPLATGKGGFLASNTDEIENNSLDNAYYENLLIELTNLNHKLDFFKSKSKSIKEDLKKFNILYPDEESINVVIACDTEELNKLIDYCKTNDYYFVKCPSYIKVNKPGISIEVKRIKFKNNSWL